MMETKAVTGPVLKCGALPAFDMNSWAAIDDAFRGAAACTLGQTWLAAPAPGFRPATVRTGWRPDALYVLADLEDADIFNPETRFNEPSFQFGDVFEMFLRPENQDPYYEIHVTPENQKFQLRVPFENGVFKVKPPPGAFLPPEWMVQTPIESRVSVNVAQARWRALAVIPFSLVVEAGVAGAGMRWRFSFSRYDYTRGAEQPVHSSTSPHPVLSFHRQQEWGTLLFV
jgi:hypothetical protein